MMVDVGQTGVSGEQSRRFATVNDDEYYIPILYLVLIQILFNVI
jgi:hypothetical protein